MAADMLDDSINKCPKKTMGKRVMCAIPFAPPRFDPTERERALQGAFFTAIAVE
jgi:hypothetical protein